MSAAAFRIGDLELRSRLIIGSGKFRSFEENRKALDAGGCEMTTVAVRRVDLSRRDGGSLLDWIPPDRFHIMPNGVARSVAVGLSELHVAGTGGSASPDWPR